MTSNSILIKPVRDKKITIIYLTNDSNETIINLSVVPTLNGNYMRPNLFWEKIDSKNKITFGITWLGMQAGKHVDLQIQWYDEQGHLYTKPKKTISK
jgi:hypothetical protein